MALNVNYIEKEEYLLVEVSGDWSIADAEEIMSAIAERANIAGVNRVLLDRRKLAESPKEEFARFAAGEALAKLMPSPFRFAAVYPNDQIDRFGENVAVNRGATAAIFSNMEDAISWVTSK